MPIDGAHHHVQREGRDHRSKELDGHNDRTMQKSRNSTYDKPGQLLIEETSTLFEGEENSTDWSTEG